MRRKSIRNIPKGDYCYKLLKHLVDEKGMPYWTTKLCPYYCHSKWDKKYKSKWAYCNYVNDFGGALLDDQCKICGIKVPEEDPEIQKAIEEYNDNKNTKQI